RPQRSTRLPVADDPAVVVDTAVQLGAHGCGDPMQALYQCSGRRSADLGRRTDYSHDAHEFITVTKQGCGEGIDPQADLIRSIVEEPLADDVQPFFYLLSVGHGMLRECSKLPP